MSWRDAITIGRYGVKNAVNRIDGTPIVWIAVIGFELGLVGMGLSPGSSSGVLGLARALLDGNSSHVAHRLSTTTASFFVLLTLFAAVRWTDGSGEKDPHETGFLSVTSARNVALGTIVKTATLLFAGIFPVITTLSLVFGSTAGKPVAGVVLLVPICLLFLTTQLLGAVLGMTVQYGITLSGVSKQADAVINLAAASISGIVFGYSAQVGERLLGTPVGAIPKVLLWVVVPNSVTTGGTLTVAAGLLVVNLLGVFAVNRFAESFYLDSSPPKSTAKEPNFDEREYDDRGSLRSFTDRLFPTRQSVLVALNWRRVMRSSELLERIGLYLILGLTIGGGTIIDGNQLGRVPIVLVLFGSVFTGAVVTTNALSEEGHRLALWGTTTVSSRDIYVSRAASMAIPSIAVFGTGAVLTAVTVSEYSPLSVLIVAVLSVFAIGASAFIATGFGCLWLVSPDGDEDSEMTLPSFLVSSIHTAFMTLLLSPMIGVILGSVERTSSQPTILLGGVFVGTVVALVGCSAIFFRTSVRKMDERHYESLL